MNFEDYFDSTPPTVELIGTVASPYDLSIATARTCYSSKGIITPQEVAENDRAKILRDRIARSTREAGHVTTRQHAHFVFAINHVSRQFLWSFLHSHPYYNSEQVSQRYVRVKYGNFTIPKLPPSEKTIFKKILDLQMEAYEKLILLLIPAIKKEYYRIFPNRLGRNEKRWEKVIEKKAFGIARYVLPVATQAYLYHTVSALTLIRYLEVSKQIETPLEQRIVVSKMVDQVLKKDPDFAKELGDGTLSTKQRFKSLNLNQAKIFTQNFDKDLQGRVSKLVDHSRTPIETLTRAAQLILGREDVSQEEALNLILNPSKNERLAETLNLTTLSPLSCALHQVHFTFLKKLSHTADSQNQRHRMTPAVRPSLEAHYFGEPDIIYPKLLYEVKEARQLYEDIVCQTVEAINTLLDHEVIFQNVAYLLPNGWAVRLEESGDLLNWHHKWKLRTCYNAQEEIFWASVDELKEISQKFPEIGRHILAPCYLRKKANLSPHCPEGERYCGVPVWKMKISEYDRLI